jgi:hypothetical protein
MWVVVFEYPDEDPVAVGPFQTRQSAVDYISQSEEEENGPIGIVCELIEPAL